VEDVSNLSCILLIYYKEKSYDFLEKLGWFI